MNTRTAAIELVVNHGPEAQTFVDTYRGGVPYLVVTDGMAEVVIKPRDDLVTADSITFADLLADAAQQYAAELRATDR